MKTLLYSALLLSTVAVFAATNADQTATVAIGGKNITIKYSSPAVNNRAGKISAKTASSATTITIPCGARARTPRPPCTPMRLSLSAA